MPTTLTKVRHFYEFRTNRRNIPIMRFYNYILRQKAPLHQNQQLQKGLLPVKSVLASNRNEPQSNVIPFPHRSLDRVLALASLPLSPTQYELLLNARTAQGLSAGRIVDALHLMERHLLQRDSRGSLRLTRAGEALVEACEILLQEPLQLTRIECKPRPVVCIGRRIRRFAS